MPLEPHITMNLSKTRWIVWIVVVIAVVYILIGSVKKTPNAVVKVGVIAPLSGVVADYGEQVKKGIESIGTTTGVQFVYEDDQCDSKTAVTVFKRLTEVEKVNYIIGPACGSPQEAIVPLLKGSSHLMIVPAAASRTLFEASGGNFYDIQYSLEDEAAFLANKMYEMGYKKVVIISYQNEFSKVEHDSFVANFKGEIVHDIDFATDNADVQTELTKIKNGGYDAVFSNNITFYFGNGLQKMRNLGIKVPVFSPYPVELPAVRQLVEGVYYSFPSDINDGQGGIYGLSKQAAELFVNVAASCGDDYACAKSFFDKGGFDKFGVRQRTLVLKRIVNGQPEIVK